MHFPKLAFNGFGYCSVEVFVKPVHYPFKKVGKPNESVF